MLGLFYVFGSATAGVAAVMWHHTRRRQRAEGHALVQSQRDALTGLANRPALLQQVEQAMRNEHGTSALLLIDMVGFRDITTCSASTWAICSCARWPGG